MANTASHSRTLTLVFTDLADSTALKGARGDQAVSDLIERHRAIVRRVAVDCDGRIIDWAGDGCFLTFDTPSAYPSTAAGGYGPATVGDQKLDRVHVTLLCESSVFRLRVHRGPRERMP